MGLRRTVFSAIKKTRFTPGVNITASMSMLACGVIGLFTAYGRLRNIVVMPAAKHITASINWCYQGSGMGRLTMVTIEAIILGQAVMESTMAKLEDVMRFQGSSRLTHSQRVGLDNYALHLMFSLHGVLQRNQKRAEQLQEAEKLGFKLPQPEILPF